MLIFCMQCMPTLLELDAACNCNIPTKLEAGHCQYATFVYFKDLHVDICDQREWLWLILLLALSYHCIFHVLINCIPDATFARTFA